jgi:hypothetical protein
MLIKLPLILSIVAVVFKGRVDLIAENMALRHQVSLMMSHTEVKVKLSRRLVDTQRRYEGLEDLQAETNRRGERWAQRSICPATGRSVDVR